MQIHKEFKSISGKPAVAIMLGLFAFIYFTSSKLYPNPETDESLQALLKTDIERYLSSTDVLSSVEMLEQKLKSGTSSDLIKTTISKNPEPEILSLVVKKPFSNLYCGEDRQYDVTVRYKTSNEKSANLRYCFKGRNHWYRARSFII